MGCFYTTMAMADDASIAALRAQLYQYELDVAAANEELTELTAQVTAVEANIAALDTKIDAITAMLAAVRLAPSLTSLSTYSMTRGDTGVVLTVTGANFVTAVTKVRIDGIELATTVVSATSATAAIADAYLDDTGTLTIDLSTAAPGGGISSSLTISVVNGDPTIATISPTTVAAGAGATVLTVAGTWFYDDSVITLNGVSYATTLIGDDLRCTVPAPLLTVAGVNVSVSVVNPAPGGGQASPEVLVVT